MLGTYADTRALPWPVSVPRRRHRVAVGPTGRQVLRQGLRGAVQATCLSAAMLIAAGVVGASRGPVVLNEPSQPNAAHVSVAAGSSVSVEATPKLTTR